MSALLKTRTLRIAVPLILILIILPFAVMRSQSNNQNVVVVSSNQSSSANIQAKAQSTNRKVLRIKSIEYPNLDPQATGGNAQASIENALFRGLLRYDQDGNPIPSIALEVPSLANGGISADGKIYTFHLKDWKWSDGKGMVTADDFVYSFQRLVDPKTASTYGALLNGVVVNATEIQAGKMPPTALGVKAIDAKTFQVSLVKPVSYFNAIASMWITFAVRKDNVERAGLPKPDAWSDPANGEVVGAGPFRFIKWDHNNRMIFERNPNFSGLPAKLDSIEFVLINDPQVAYAAYNNNELEISSFPSEEYEHIQADSVLGKELTQYSAACTNFLAMDNAHPPFDNKKVRQAFTYALNRDLREKVIDQGINVKQLSWLPAGVPGYDPNLGKENDFNEAKAKQTLAEAGYPDAKGLPEVTFTYPNVPAGETVANWYKAQFKQVLNVDITLKPMDLKEFVHRLYPADAKDRLPGLFENGWCADYLHPSDWMYFVFGSTQANNSVSYNDPKFDELSQAADIEPDQDKAMQEYIQAHELLLSDFPVIFFNTSRATKLVKACVKNVKPSALDGGMIGGFFWEDIDVDGCKQ